jgi:hypothetical protein
MASAGAPDNRWLGDGVMFLQYSILGFSGVSSIWILTTRARILLVTHGMRSKLA